MNEREHITLSDKIEEFGYDVRISLSKLMIIKDKETIYSCDLGSYGTLITQLKYYYKKISRIEKIKNLINEENRNEK